MVTRLGRLVRSTRDLLNTLAASPEGRLPFRSLGEAWQIRQPLTDGLC
jgi:hypothetical protein